MIVTIYVFMLLALQDGRITLTPHLVMGQQQCQALIDVERTRNRDNVAAYCVPAGGAIDFDITEPSS